MSSLPFYFLSFFKVPIGIISSIESLLKCFFYGEDSRKISSFSWDSIGLGKEVGDLGVRKIREFNLALLGEWCWKMYADKETI